MGHGKNIGLNEVAVGIRMPTGIAELASLTLGPRPAQLMVLTGKLWTAEEALKLGAVDEVVPVDEVVSRSTAVLQSWLGSTQPIAVSGTMLF